MSEFTEKRDFIAGCLERCANQIRDAKNSKQIEKLWEAIKDEVDYFV
jgi:hypothetical protein